MLSYEIFLGIVVHEKFKVVSDDLFGHFHSHVVGIVGVLDDSGDDEPGYYLCQHDYYITW